MTGLRKATRVQDEHHSLGLSGIRVQDGKQVAGRISSGRMDIKVLE